jgi:FtsZ-interacting cell division protein ZipA
MDSQTLTLIAIVIALAVVIGVALYVVRNRRTELLKRRFGSEYDHTLDAFGSRSTAEADLVDRTKRVKEHDIHPLSRSECDRFADRWRKTQASFVDNPVSAVAEADALVEEVMQARGYPVADFERRADDISVDHPRFVQNYRDAHAIAVSARRGTARTEDLRRATLYFRELFEDLLESVTHRSGDPATT